MIESEKRMHPVKEAFLSIMGFVGFGVLVAYAVTGGIFFTQVNNNVGSISSLQAQLAATQAALNATNAIVANLTANSGGGGGGGGGGSAPVPNSTVVETGTFEWQYQDASTTFATYSSISYTLTRVDVGTFRYYTLELQTPPSGITVPSCSVFFRARATNFSPANSILLGYGNYLLIKPEDRANIQLACYQTGTCFLGDYPAGNNGAYVQGDGVGSTVDYQFYGPAGGCAVVVGETFALTGTMNILIPSF